MANSSLTWPVKAFSSDICLQVDTNLSSGHQQELYNEFRYVNVVMRNTEQWPAERLKAARLNLNDKLRFSPPEPRQKKVPPIYTRQELEDTYGKRYWWNLHSDSAFRRLNWGLLKHLRAFLKTMRENKIPVSGPQFAKFDTTMFDDGASVMTRLWSSEELYAIKTLLEERFKSVETINLCCEIHDPWNGQPLHRPRELSYIEMEFSMSASYVEIKCSTSAETYERCEKRRARKKRPARLKLLKKTFGTPSRPRTRPKKSRPIFLELACQPSTCSLRSYPRTIVDSLESMWPTLCQKG